MSCSVAVLMSTSAACGASLLDWCAAHLPVCQAGGECSHHAAPNKHLGTKGEKTSLAQAAPCVADCLHVLRALAGQPVHMALCIGLHADVMHHRQAVHMRCRLTCYALLPLAGNPWVVLPVELLHGVTFGCSWAAGTVNCARISPPGLKSTTQVWLTCCSQNTPDMLGARHVC